MKPNILFINPWIHDFSAYDYWMKPLGLLYMAAYLRNNAMNVRFIDCLTPKDPFGGKDPGLKIPTRKTGGHGKFPKEAIQKPIALSHISKPFNRYGMTESFFKNLLRQGPRPDLVMTSVMMTYWYPGAFDAIKIVKEIYPGVPIVLGGNYVTLCPDHASKSGADFLLSGEGEYHIPFIVRNILGSSLLYEPDLEQPGALPYPALDLLIEPDQAPILTSRGCPFRCAYCASHRLNRGFIRRQPSDVVNEMVHWEKKLGVRDFSFYDDALFTKPDHMAFPIMHEIIDRGLSYRFHCPNGLHLREITPELARLMFASGFKSLRFGFETSDTEKQLALGGKANNSHLEMAMAYLREAGYDTHDIGIYILCGLPGQAYQEVYETIRYVRSRGAKPILAEFSPIPQTMMWQTAVDASLFPIEEEPLFHNNSLLSCRDESITLSGYHELKRLTRTL
ncbi:MAG: 2-hydroxyethylphosphonate methyltransferase [Syntrophus sp. SKADARSKE-3]|nr:2-hydroxyethylphosphonate methyltransferase [Syntrophus sp. SKADARSKE-3]